MKRKLRIGHLYPKLLNIYGDGGNIITLKKRAEWREIEVEVHELPFKKGDRFLLCSDGIHGTMPEREFIKMTTKSGSSLGAITDDIATYVDNLGRSGGGEHDNMTLAIVETKADSKLKPSQSTSIKSVIIALFVICILVMMLFFLSK